MIPQKWQLRSQVLELQHSLQELNTQFENRYSEYPRFMDSFRRQYRHTFSTFVKDSELQEFISDMTGQDWILLSIEPSFEGAKEVSMIRSESEIERLTKQRADEEMRKHTDFLLKEAHKTQKKIDDLEQLKEIH